MSYVYYLQYTVSEKSFLQDNNDDAKNDFWWFR